MGILEKRNIDSPHENRPFRAHGHADVVTLGDFTIGRGTFEPGWTWSNDVKPIAGTDSCQVRHTGVFVSGRMTVRADDGTEVSYGPVRQASGVTARSRRQQTRWPCSAAASPRAVSSASATILAVCLHLGKLLHQRNLPYVPLLGI